MKKLLTTSILASALIAVPAFADSQLPIEMIDVKIEPISIEVEKQENQSDIIIRNNVITSDYKYNNSHYYTSKITTEKLVIPENVEKEAKKIYFLVEQGGNRYYQMEKMISADMGSAVEVNEKYNFKTVEFDENKKEYIFSNKDLVQDFGKDQYANVTITLVAELNDGKTLPLSQSAYVSIANKEGILSSLSSKQEENFYFGYYNSSDLELYLEEMAENMTRKEYKTMLGKANNKIETALTKNENLKNDILNKIKKESDFKKYIEKYQQYTETRKLMNTLNSAVKNQLQNMRAFDAIDLILK